MNTLYVVSGEGDTGTREPYTGRVTARALNARLTRERCNGDRWARLEVALDGDLTRVVRVDVETALRMCGYHHSCLNMEGQTMNSWDFGGYWNTVLGAYRTAEDVVREFNLDTEDRLGLDEWLGEAEVAALYEGGIHAAMPDAWLDFHTRALNLLCEVSDVV